MFIYCIHLFCSTNRVAIPMISSRGTMDKLGREGQWGWLETTRNQPLLSQASNSLASPESSVLLYLILCLLCVDVFHSLSIQRYLCFLLVFEPILVCNSAVAS
jgi:hypothetical protein